MKNNQNEIHSFYKLFELGSSRIKVGFNGESCPRFIIPNIIGKKNLIHIIKK